MIPVAADAEQALAMIRSHPDGTVVDVRDEEEYITGHLADAVLLPVDEISAETAVGHTVSNKQIHKTEPIPFPGTGSM